MLPCSFHGQSWTFLTTGCCGCSILPEFRETREIHRLKNHQVQWLSCKELPGLSATEQGRVCWAPAQPHTSPLGERPLLGIAARCSSKAANLCTGLCGANPPSSAPSPHALWLLSLKQSGNPSVFPHKHITPSTPYIPLASQPLPSQGTPERAGANTNGCSSLPTQHSRSLPGISPTAMEGADSSRHPAAPAWSTWPWEHGWLCFHCKLEINHSRKFPC